MHVIGRLKWPNMNCSQYISYSYSFCGLKSLLKWIGLKQIFRCMQVEMSRKWVRGGCFSRLSRDAIVPAARSLQHSQYVQNCYVITSLFLLTSEWDWHSWGTIRLLYKDDFYLGPINIIVNFYKCYAFNSMRFFMFSVRFWYICTSN